MILNSKNITGFIGVITNQPEKSSGAASRFSAAGNPGSTVITVRIRKTRIRTAGKYSDGINKYRHYLRRYSNADARGIGKF